MSSIRLGLLDYFLNREIWVQKSLLYGSGIKTPCSIDDEVEPSQCDCERCLVRYFAAYLYKACDHKIVELSVGPKPTAAAEFVDFQIQCGILPLRVERGALVAKLNKLFE